ncbi:Long-chain fatty alcohol dehydrogenase family protein [Prunus dulcis]|uniref:Long-chain fatty alcohol dehydrogenase family protein n=1 Tax=Prunus dulcis TaxID=3755 RepID=A0A4Y1QM43_PRUDU|nr:Long-chain fatty alcohol dehydrogenase family protein [Prunus dulcis]
MRLYKHKCGLVLLAKGKKVSTIPIVSSTISLLNKIFIIIANIMHDFFEQMRLHSISPSKMNIRVQRLWDKIIFHKILTPGMSMSVHIWSTAFS